MARRFYVPATPSGGRTLLFPTGSLSFSPFAPTFTIGGGGGGAGAPALLYTDITDGSTSNGENGNGAYLSIFGYGFGAAAGLGTTTKVFLRDSAGIAWREVAAYRYLTNAKNFATHAIQHICVQPGSLGSATAGDIMNIKVTVSGVDSNIDRTFQVQVGDFYFVNNLTGSDTTGVKNDPTKPFRFLQKGSGSTFSGIFASGKIKPGDTIVLQDTGTIWVDKNGVDDVWFRSSYPGMGGSPPTGVVGHGHIHITAAPTSTGPAVVKYNANVTGGGVLVGPDSGHALVTGMYISISNLVVFSGTGSASDGAPINLQSAANGWRVVNNECSWPATGTALAGAITGNGNPVWILGNYAHDILGGDSNHGIYLDGSANGSGTFSSCAQNAEMAWNRIENVTGSLMQLHNQIAANTFINISIHHNNCKTAGKYGNNIDTSTQIVSSFCNIFQGTFRNGLRVDTDNGQTGVAINIENDTYYDCYHDTTGAYPGMVSQEAGIGSGAINVKNCIFALAASRTNTNVSFVQDNGGAMTFNGNLYYDFKGLVTVKYSADAGGIYANPLFTTPGSDFSLQATSPALARAVAASINPTTDFLNNPNPRSGKATRSVGAYA